MKQMQCRRKQGDEMNDINTCIYEITKKEKEWIKEFKALLNREPKRIEVVVNNGDIRIYKAGSLSKHIGSKHDGWDIDTNPDIEKPIFTFQNKGTLLPYSEGQ